MEGIGARKEGKGGRRDRDAGFRQLLAWSIRRDAQKQRQQGRARTFLPMCSSCSTISRPMKPAPMSPDNDRHALD
eukprot:367450-Rhodomonas_salina.1